MQWAFNLHGLPHFGGAHTSPKVVGISDVRYNKKPKRTTEMMTNIDLDGCLKQNTDIFGTNYRIHRFAWTNETRSDNDLSGPKLKS